MTNEELAERIQAGERDLILELWGQVKRLVFRLAHRYFIFSTAGQSGKRGRGGVELEDLEQAGFLGMLAAIDSFEPDSGKFTTWLGLHLKIAFAQATNSQSERKRMDPLNYAGSIDAPLGEDADGDTLADALPATDIWGDIDYSLWSTDARAVFLRCLDSLPAPQGEILRRRYFDGETREAISADLGVTYSQAVVMERAAIQALRLGWRRRALQGLKSDSALLQLPHTETEISPAERDE